ncbi:MAG TPA: response regulator [Pseudolabrys sp.]|nr:response regulator [Pseudolabrys sp.]
MSHSKINLLVADDAPAVHQIIERAAAAYPGERIECFRAMDGRECLQAFTDGYVDVAFIDVIMPEMSGLEALSNVRFMGSEAFITLMSAKPDERAFATARELAAYEFLLKPFGTKDIEAILKTYMRIRRHMSVLVVDDSAATRAIIRKVLDRSIFRLQIEEVASGEKAIAACETRAFDLIFLDCNMPGLNGIETLDRLRKNDPSSRIVMMSAQRGQSLEQSTMERGAAAFLYKPFYPTEIDVIIHQMFGLRSPRLKTFRPGALSRFDVSIVGRTIEARHRDSGHLYRFLWFREAPYLRSAQIIADPHTRTAPMSLAGEAEKAAMAELVAHGLLTGAASQAAPSAGVPRLQRVAV